MHDCPWCGMACDCDGEDTWLEPPYDCDHCPDGDISTDDYDYDDFRDENEAEP